MITNRKRITTISNFSIIRVIPFPILKPNKILRHKTSIEKMFPYGFNKHVFRKPEANPNEYVNALHLRSGRQLPSGDRIEDNADQVGEVEQSHDTETTVLDDENTAGGNEENTGHS
ncbi:unnamed protein product, partial [Cochlearia groenlandica]